MNDVGELKQYIEVHARAQRIPDTERRLILDRIHDDGDGDGSWAREWVRAGEQAEKAGQLQAAVRHFTTARFPYVDGPARQEATDRAAAAFERWRQAEASVIEPLTVDTPAGTVRAWTAGLSARDPKPLLLFSGGIVSTKEQWAPVLLQVARLGMAGLVTELPGIGGNTLVYGPDSHRLFPALLDAVADRARTAQSYAVALSFSGHLALRAALDDRRLRGIVTAGAPLHHFFTDEAWQRQLPRITVDTLAHLSAVEPADLGPHIRDWALSEDELAALDIPLAYLVSGRDEIVPAGEVALLRRQVRRLSLLVNDDVHGSPRHAAETPLWAVLSILRMRGVRDPRRALFGALWRLARLRARRAG
ncbi:alpha/beta hydrolase [Kitasatospora sp. NPDC058170]|uniref:alpha/beta hydrolase n=1 Tax=Kitasatospora sp. NPDC058170 TaxID=3346364 RepID=UPI0036D98E74